MKQREEARQAVDDLVTWFARPTGGRPAALLRIGLGVFALDYALRIWLNLERLYSEDGQVPWRLVQHFPEHAVSLLARAPQHAGFVQALALLLVVSAGLLTVGWWPRSAAFVFWLVNLGFIHRNPYVINRGDQLLSLVMALAVLMPLGHAWSLDAWFRRRRGKATPSATLWSQRLLALQICYIYLYAFTSKLGKLDWLSGAALGYALKMPEMAEWPALPLSAPVLALGSWATLLFELTFPVLVWKPRWRWWMLGAGVLFHVGIAVLMRVPMFSWIMIVSYAAFLEDRHLTSRDQPEQLQARSRAT